MSKLKEIRKKQGIGQIELAEITGVSIRAIRAFEYNERPINNASCDVVYRLSKALNCAIEDLLDIEEITLKTDKNAQNEG